MNALAPVRDTKKASAPAESLAGAWRSIPVPQGVGKFWRKLAAFSGPGYLVAVGYMDPGNWATDIAGGSAYGYSLLSVMLGANLMAILLQSLCARLGIATGMDLAQACRDQYRPATRISLWLFAEIAIIACDLAEVIGTAIALQLLFGLPLVWGVALTALDVFVILALEKRGFRKVEAFIIALMAIIMVCFVGQMILSQPSIAAVAAGFVPQASVITDPGKLYLAIGILGATVMPHNLYLHSSLVQTRKFDRSPSGKREAIRMAGFDSTIALSLALFVNAAILILAASEFHANGQTQIAEIGDAFKLLSPPLGLGIAGILFAVALLAAGQNSTITGTLAGQIVMEGFVGLRLPNWARRLITRALAIIPAAFVAGWYGDNATAHLLILSQVVLSLQLPFAVVPLVRFTSNRKMMGEFACGGWTRGAAWAVTAIVIVLNSILLWSVA